MYFLKLIIIRSFFILAYSGGVVTMTIVRIPCAGGAQRIGDAQTPHHPPSSTPTFTKVIGAARTGYLYEGSRNITILYTSIISLPTFFCTFFQKCFLHFFPKTP